jgi:hypothetical protein
MLCEPTHSVHALATAAKNRGLSGALKIEFYFHTADVSQFSTPSLVEKGDDAMQRKLTTTSELRQLRKPLSWTIYIVEAMQTCSLSSKTALASSPKEQTKMRRKWSGV